jgi:hypothetical protein
MNTMIALEFFKMKRRRFFLPIVLFSIIGILWCMVIVIKEWQFSSLNKTMYVLINDLIIVNSMILPLLIGTLCSRLMDIEYSGKTFRLLQTSNQNLNQLFMSKIVTAGIVIILLSLAQSVFIVGMSYLYRVDINIQLLLAFFLSFLLASFVLILLHLSLSLFFEKQSVSIVVALIGGFVGLVTGGMLPWFIQLILPWQYYNLLNPVNRVVVNEQYHYSFNSHYFIFIFIIFILLIMEAIIIKKKVKGVEIL